jgi:hypothetical protein
LQENQAMGHEARVVRSTKANAREVADNLKTKYGLSEIVARKRAATIIAVTEKATPRRGTRN